MNLFSDEFHDGKVGGCRSDLSGFLNDSSMETSGTDVGNERSRKDLLEFLNIQKAAMLHLGQEEARRVVERQISDLEFSGNNLAREIMSGYAAASVIAMHDQVIVKELQKLFHSGLFRVYTNHDVIGCELGGVLKNIIAIATGMGDGQGAGENTRSARSIDGKRQSS